MSRRLTAAALGLGGLALLAAGPAAALEYQHIRRGGETVVVVTGEFNYGDEARFRREIQSASPVAEVVFASGGGNVVAALEIGRFLRRSGLPTRVARGDSCASACVYALIGGIFRTVEPGARIGVHMSSISGNKELLQEVTETIRRKGAAGAYVVMNMIEQSAASVMAKQAKYLVEMSVSMELMHPITDTFSNDMHWLSASELQRYNVVN